MDKKTEFLRDYPKMTMVLKAMCDAVDVNFDSIDFWNQDESYFMKHSWSEEQETNFSKWLAGNLMVNKELREEMMRVPSKNKKLCEKCANEFIWNYGWKTNYLESND